MKVIVLGTHGVGKTTLIESIDDIFKPLVIPEQVRVLADTFPGFQHSQNATLTTQNAIFEQYLQEFSIRNNYISDRGLLDVLAYTLSLGLKCRTPRDWDVYDYHIQKEHEILDLFIRENKDIHYIYIPIEFKVINDGFRDTDETYRTQIDRSICSLIDEHNEDIGEITVIRGTQEERVDQFNTLLHFWMSTEE